MAGSGSIKLELFLPVQFSVARAAPSATSSSIDSAITLVQFCFFRNFKRIQSHGKYSLSSLSLGFLHSFMVLHIRTVFLFMAEHASTEAYHSLSNLLKRDTRTISKGKVFYTKNFKTIHQYSPLSRVHIPSTT